MGGHLNGEIYTHLGVDQPRVWSSPSRAAAWPGDSLSDQWGAGPGQAFLTIGTSVEANGRFELFFPPGNSGDGTAVGLWRRATTFIVFLLAPRQSTASRAAEGRNGRL